MPFALDFHRSVFFYDKKTIGRLIQSFKHQQKYWLNDLLGSFLAHHLEKHPWAEKNYVLMPVPLHWGRLSQRGFNQSGVLASFLAKKWNKPVVSWIYRKRYTDFQRNKNMKERQENIKGAFAVFAWEKEKIHNTLVILVDDVFTTGSTLCECAVLLKEQGALAVGALTLARV
jgi:ComF family protein